MSQASIASSLQKVQEQIAKSMGLRKGFEHPVLLLAVSKTQSVEAIQAAHAAGQNTFGENYVQELVKKKQSLPDLEWHFIGALQSNKISQLVGKVSLIHSVDREKLLTAIQRQSQAQSLIQDILLEVNIGDETTKSGVTIEQLPALVKFCVEQPNLRLRGLMALPPPTIDESEARRNFAKMRQLFEQTRGELSAFHRSHFDELSMGTSADFGWAIEEGATIVRVGELIFGPRS